MYRYGSDGSHPFSGQGEAKKIMEECNDFFKGFGLFDGKYHIHIHKSELDLMEKLNVIAKVTEPTDRVNSDVQKANADIGICLDPKYLNHTIR